MGLSSLRIEDITLHNYIKHEVAGLNFVEQLSNQSLTYSSTLDLWLPSYTDLIPSPVSVGRGWTVFDETSSYIDTGSEQTSRISVAGASTYDVNYILGGIRNPNTTPTTVTYTWNYVSVIDGWPGGDPPDIPIVAIDVVGTSRSGFQLGSGHVSSRDVSLHVFAPNNAERDDITEALFDALYNKMITVVDYAQGDYLDSDGFFDSSFTAPTNSAPSTLLFDNVTSRTINSSVDWTDLNRYRSVVSFNMVSYIE